MAIGSIGAFLPLAGGTLTGNLTFSPDNTLDIGVGSLRPRNLFVGNNVAVGNDVSASGYFKGSNSNSRLYLDQGDGIAIFYGNAGRTVGTRLTYTTDGVLVLQNIAGTGFTRLAFGGVASTNSAFNAGGTSIQAVLADNSNWARFEAGLIRSYSDTAVAAGGIATMGLQISSSFIGVYVGSGAPTLSAAKGSLYLRSDGSTTNDRAYVNTNGTTGWTALTTAS